MRKDKENEQMRGRGSEKIKKRRQRREGENAEKKGRKKTRGRRPSDNLHEPRIPSPAERNQRKT